MTTNGNPLGSFTASQDKPVPMLREPKISHLKDVGSVFLRNVGKSYPAHSKTPKDQSSSICLEKVEHSCHINIFLFRTYNF